MTIQWNSFLRGSALAAVALGLACSERPDPAGPGIVADATAPSATQAMTYSGRATVVQVTLLTPVSASVPLVDAGPLPSSGGAMEASLLNASVPGLLTAEVLDAETVGQGNASRSEASVAEVALTVGGNNISADFLESRATAMCTDGGATASGSSDIAALSVNGQTIAVSGAPNQTVDLPGGGQLIINEQRGGPGDITVNALHVIVPGVADVIISSAHADITCQPAPPPPPPPGCTPADFITGGGWIITPSGAKANFGVGGGIKQSVWWGHLTYIDHGAGGPQVKGTGVTGYTSPDPTKPTMRHISGTAEVNGQGGFTYQIDVADNGEPGRNDTFAISLSNGYTASGTLDGGNIQLHTPTCQ